MTLLSVFGGGLWIIPVGILLAIIWSTYRGIRSSKSGSGYNDQSRGGKWVDTPGNVKFYNTFAGRVAIALFVIDIIIVLMMRGDK